jgi:glutamate-1-semialdehyde 2,1-aminomutase
VARLRNDELYARAARVMPGGVSSPVRAFRAVGGTPRALVRGEGARVWDVEGRSYVDFQMSFGPLILGHAHPAVVAAIREAAARGTTFAAPHPDEVALAELVLSKHPAAKWVRFVSSGTEAVMSAIRVARAATGRSLFLKFEACYHGHSDALLVKGGSGLVTLGLSSSAGVTPGTVADTATIPLDDDEALETFFREHGRRTAAVLIEGVPANDGLLVQRPEFVRKVARLAHEHGALLVFDEVITGFRLGWGGAAAKYGVTPDLVTFGKIVGGGLPVGAYGGRRDLMDLVAPLGPVYQAGTLSGNPLAMAAGLATLRALEAADPFDVLARKTEAFAKRLGDALKDGVVVTEGSMFWLAFATREAPRRADRVAKEQGPRFAAVHRALLDRGVFMPPSGYEVGFLSTAHDDEALDAAARAFEEALR